MLRKIPYNLALDLEVFEVRTDEHEPQYRAGYLVVRRGDRRVMVIADQGTLAIMEE